MLSLQLGCNLKRNGRQCVNTQNGAEQTASLDVQRRSTEQCAGYSLHGLCKDDTHSREEQLWCQCIHMSSMLNGYSLKSFWPKKQARCSVILRKKDCRHLFGAVFVPLYGRFNFEISAPGLPSTICPHVGVKKIQLLGHSAVLWCFLCGLW